MLFQSNGPNMPVGVHILISHKIHVKETLIKRDGEGHFIYLKGKINPDDISVLNTYAPNEGHPHL